MVTKKTKKPVKKTRKNGKKNQTFNFLKVALPAGAAILGVLGVTGIVNLVSQEKQVELHIEYSEKTTEPSSFDKGGEVVEEIPTVEEIDGGGRFKDNINIDNGEPQLYYELGSIEEVDTSSPEAFKKSTLGRCIIGNN